MNPQKFSEFPVGARFRYVKQGRFDQSCFRKNSHTTYVVDGREELVMAGDPMVLPCGHPACGYAQ